ncbi:MAG: hypothetical protein ACPGXY_03655 [Alphaproteobacteria bacterium]
MKKLALALSCFALAGCSGPKKEELNQHCPKATVVGELSKIHVHSKDGQRRLASIEIDGIDPRCSFEGSTCTFGAFPTMTAIRRANDAPQKIEGTYMIAVVDAGNHIIGKHSFPVRFTFDPDQRKEGLDLAHTCQITVPQGGRLVVGMEKAEGK